MKLLQQGEKLKNVEKTARKPEQHSRDRKYLKKKLFYCRFHPHHTELFQKSQGQLGKILHPERHLAPIFENFGGLP
ncbi:MAG: hypothetical protein ACOYL7_02625 [Caldilinea sp.]